MKYGLIGEHLPHSFSREIHAKIADYDYELCELLPEEVESFIKKKDFTAINVTIPYKEKVMPYLDSIDEKARLIGAVNTIVNRNGKLYGYNTDFIGLCDLIEKNSIVIKDKKVVNHFIDGGICCIIWFNETDKPVSLFDIKFTKVEGKKSNGKEI